MTKIINNKLSTIMGNKLLKITNVSKSTGISRTTLTNLYYKRSKGITFSVIEKLCSYLECDVNDLFECKK